MAVRILHRSFTVKISIICFNLVLIYWVTLIRPCGTYGRLLRKVMEKYSLVGVASQLFYRHLVRDYAGWCLCLSKSTLFFIIVLLHLIFRICSGVSTMLLMDS